MEALLTIEQAATRLQLHPETVRRQIKRGLMRAVKRGRVWRVPESALQEASLSLTTATPTAATPSDALADAEAIWREMTSGDAARHNNALRALFDAPASVRAIITQRSAQAAAAYYATPQGEAELSDWRALDGEPFHDDGDAYFSNEEEASFRAQKAARGASR